MVYWWYTIYTESYYCKASAANLILGALLLSTATQIKMEKSVTWDNNCMSWGVKCSLVEVTFANLKECMVLS